MNWVGVLIGVFSTLFIYPHALEEYGLMRFLLDTSMLLFPLLSIGINSLTIRFFPQFENSERGHHGFLGVLLLWGVAGYAFFALLALLGWPYIFEFYKGRSVLFPQYLWLLFPLSFLTLLNSIFSQYTINFKRIVIPSLLLDFSQKVTLPLLVLAYWQHWISLELMLTGVVVYMVVVTAGFVTYIVYLRAWFWRPDFYFFNWAMVRKMLDYAAFGMIGGIGFVLVSKLDGWFVTTYINLKSNGIYAISAFIANVMEVPARAVITISIPLIAKHFHEKNMDAIALLYRQVSINMFIAGLLLFGAFWVSVTPFFQIIANGDVLEVGRPVILLLGTAKLVDMATGLNNYILNYSPYFRYSYLQIALPAILSIGLSIWLVPVLGMTGAAIASLCATSFYNLISLGLNWYFFRMQPFSMQLLKALLFAGLAFGITWLLPMPAQAWVAVFVKSGTFTLLFGVAILGFDVSPDLNNLVNKFLKR